MRNRENLRIVSLLPSATEIVAYLGLADVIVGRSHECDYPPAIKHLPACTQSKFNPVGSSREIHDRVNDLLQKTLSVYQVKTDILQQLQPTHIITQAQCDVCACSLTDVEKAVHNLLGSKPQIISLQPNLLAEIWQDIERVANALGVDGKQALASLQSRFDFFANQTYTTRPTVACIEWLDPLMIAGNWIPELVILAGGNPLFGIIGKHSSWLKWDDLVAASPQVIIFMPCGFDLERTLQDTRQITNNTEWQKLQAFRHGKVYVTDGNSYFNRPGPRLVDSLEILAEILHPEKFQFGYQGTGWQRLETWQ